MKARKHAHVDPTRLWPGEGPGSVDSVVLSKPLWHQGQEWQSPLSAKGSWRNRFTFCFFNFVLKRKKISKHGN